MPQVHSSAEQNLSYNFETLHRARAVKLSTVVIFEDTKHLVLGLFNSPTVKGNNYAHNWWDVSYYSDTLYWFSALIGLKQY